MTLHSTHYDKFIESARCRVLASWGPAKGVAILIILAGLELIRPASVLGQSLNHPVPNEIRNAISSALGEIAGDEAPALEPADAESNAKHGAAMSSDNVDCPRAPGPADELIGSQLSAPAYTRNGDGGPGLFGRTDSYDQAGRVAWKTLGYENYSTAAPSNGANAYRIRVDDVITLNYLTVGKPSPNQYRLQVGDILRIECPEVEQPDSFDVVVSPDGFISINGYGRIRARGRSLHEVNSEIKRSATAQGKSQQLSVSVMRTNAALKGLLQNVSGDSGFGPQVRRVRVTPTGTLTLPGIGAIAASGLTLNELQREIEAAYGLSLSGLEVTPMLDQHAAPGVYVFGHVSKPARYEIDENMSAAQVLALAGNPIPGANLRHVIVLRRGEQAEWTATEIDLHDSFGPKQPSSPHDIRLQDSDMVIVPESSMRSMDDALRQILPRIFSGGNARYATASMSTL